MMYAALCTFSSKKGDWNDQRDACSAAAWPGPVPFAGQFLCWVDFYSGIVFCDVSDEDSPVLHYTPVPGNQQFSSKRLIERWRPESFRNVSVSQGVIHVSFTSTTTTGRTSKQVTGRSLFGI